MEGVMQTFETISAAREAIMDFRADHFAELDERFKARFRELSASPSPVDQIVGLGEFIYANREDMDDAAKALGAGLIAFANVNAWHGLLDDSRGSRIVGNLRKDLGEIKTAPAAPEARQGMTVAAEVVDEPAEPDAPADDAAE